jgi:hypothetical protein
MLVQRGGGAFGYGVSGGLTRSDVLAGMLPAKRLGWIERSS